MELRPLHRSMIGVGARPPMAKQFVGEDMRQFLESEALSIFIDCTNGGCTFQQSLAAILLTGMHYAVESQKEK